MSQSRLDEQAVLTFHFCESNRRSQVRMTA